MTIDRTQILVLNYNGRALLEACLPSLRQAAEHAPVPCGLTVIDNGSTDDSLDYLARSWPGVEVCRESNRGLASFNGVLAGRTEPAVLLLNNDVKLEPDAVAPLLAALEAHDDAMFAAPLCWDFDGRTYEGMRTRVRTRFGFVQGCCRVPGHETLVGLPDLTAAAGPILMVDRRKFLELGGFDPIYFPGRIEDLDLGFRGWMRGWRGYYVPDSVAYHRGFGSFGPAFGPAGCDWLAMRNTLLFSWKNLRGWRLVEHLLWLPVRVLAALLRGRPGFIAALAAALGRLPEAWSRRRNEPGDRSDWLVRQEAFFDRFAW